MRFLLAFLILVAPVFPARAELPSNQPSCDSFRRANMGCSAEANAERIRMGCEAREREAASPNETEAMRKGRFERCLAQQASRLTTGCTFCQANFPARPTPAPGQPPGSPNPPPKAPEKPGERPESGSPRPRDPSTCEGSDSCLRDAERQNREAAARARQTREDLQRGRRELAENRFSTITAAADLLDAWQRKLEARPNAQEQARFQHDRKLYLRALDDPGFTRRDASTAYDQVVREELVNIVEMRELENSYERESDRSMVREGEFQGVAERAGSRAQALGFAGQRIESNRAILQAPAVLGGLPKSDAVNRSTIVESRGSDAPAASASRKISSAESRKAGGASGSPGGKFSDSAVYRAPSSSSPGLRDLLRRRLKGEAGSPGTGGSKLTTNAGASGRRALGEASEHSAADLAAELIASAESGGRPDVPFSGIEISAEETERQRRALMIEAGMHETLGSTGLLGADSASLFERVRHAHHGCLARGCL
jgi:hypothetical protein